VARSEISARRKSSNFRRELARRMDDFRNWLIREAA
jgi:hypothetical protein